MHVVHRIVDLNDLFVCLCAGTYHFFAVVLLGERERENGGRINDIPRVSIFKHHENERQSIELLPAEAAAAGFALQASSKMMNTCVIICHGERFNGYDKINVHTQTHTATDTYFHFHRLQKSCFHTNFLTEYTSILLLSSSSSSSFHASQLNSFRFCLCQICRWCSHCWGILSGLLLFFWFCCGCARKIANDCDSDDENLSKNQVLTDV